MDIQRSNFPAKLLDILEAISESSFVAFDLELSGVPVRPYGPRDSGKATLQERYAEVKAAAERYQILQIGLTCVKEDIVDGTYELKPYNIHLGPTLTEQLDIDRDFTFHSGAVSFLNSVNFNFQAPLAIGVPYLSRQEADLAKSRAEVRLTRSTSSYGGLDVKPEETETIALLARVKQRVDAWLKVCSPENDYLLLGPVELGSKEINPEGLSKYEKFLVHQIIRQDYPQLITIPRRGAIQVSALDEAREAAIVKSKMRDIQGRIYRQIGFRWVIEALAGQSLRHIDLATFTTDPQTGDTMPISFDVKSRFQRCQALLEGRPRPIIGHNMFLDLVYLYKTFIGLLPDKVADFAAKLHELFPVIVDTKYLATHKCGDINPMSSLQQLAEKMDRQKTPLITTHEKHDKYLDYEAHHEAGYDSMLTSKLAIRLSAKLEADKKSLEDAIVGDAMRIGPDDDRVRGGVSLEQDGTDVEGGAAPRNDAASQGATIALDDHLSNQKGSSKEASKASRFAHTTPFETLKDELNTRVVDSQEPGVAQEDHAWWFGETTTTEEGAAMANVTPDWSRQQPFTPLRLMPTWTSTFWPEYENQLRVFGTQEGVCGLTARGRAK